MNEKNLKLAQQDIDEVLKTVEELEVQIDDLSKDDLKQKFVTLTEKVRKLEDLLKDEGIISVYYTHLTLPTICSV